MSAASIPNLSSLRREGLRGRGRGSGRGSAHVGPGGDRRNVHHDEIVQNTDNDAAMSRQSAVDAGYLEDPFSALLNPGGPMSRRLPLMNRGTYVRTTGIDRIVDTFLASSGNGRKQIISLGAGSDTRYFRLKQKRRDLNVRYHEVDFETNTRRKIARLRGHEFSAAAKALTGTDMHGPEVELSQDGAKLVSSEYFIHPRDLRQLPRDNNDETAGLAGVDVTLPTLIISECCLIYLPPADADAVLHYFSSKLFPPSTPLAIVIYEPIRPHDSFGRRMVSNLMSRGIQLHTLEKYAGLEEQRERLAANGFGSRREEASGSPEGGGNGGGAGAEAADIDFIWRKWISGEEKERVEGLEWMDEVEEFVLLAQHYCICWGWRACGGDDSRWRELASPFDR